MDIAIAPATVKFEFVEEHDDFLGLFPHRFDYIYADYPLVSDKPTWRTERRYPLSDRLLQQGNHLYGVRFGTKTNYCMLDVDRDSLYHPCRDPFAIDRILEALEPFGLVSYVACTSSYSGGLHLYFPFDQAQKSWLVGAAVSDGLKNAGFLVTPGQLEVFPNAKKFYSGSGSSSKPSSLALFNAHRLPLQVGSYLLDDDFQTVWSDRHQFVKRWRFCQSRNIVDSETLKSWINRTSYARPPLSQRVEKFLQDLNSEIDLGWTGRGQTNRLLGRIAIRCYVFHHVLYGGNPLEDEDLVRTIVETAEQLPGYSEWCQHKHEIGDRAREWARSIENSHYYHYGINRKPSTSSSPRVSDNDESQKSRIWNNQKAQETKARIQRAINQLLKEGSLPGSITERFRILIQCGIGGASLYKYKDLWHPHYWKPSREPSQGSQSLLAVEVSNSSGSALSNSSGDRSLAISSLEGSNFSGSSFSDSVDGSVSVPDACVAGMELEVKLGLDIAKVEKLTALAASESHLQVCPLNALAHGLSDQHCVRLGDTRFGTSSEVSSEVSYWDARVRLCVGLKAPCASWFSDNRLGGWLGISGCRPSQRAVWDWSADSCVDSCMESYEPVQGRLSRYQLLQRYLGYWAIARWQVLLAALAHSGFLQWLVCWGNHEPP